VTLFQRRAGTALYAIIAVFALVSAINFLLVQAANDRLAQDLDPLLTLADRAQRRVVLAHLWFEEGVSGDQSISVDNDVYQNVDAARVDLRQARGSRVIDPEMAAHLDDLDDRLAEWRTLTGERWALRSSSEGAIGSERDQRFDALFETILEKTEQLSKHLVAKVERERATAKTIGILQAALNVGMFLALALMVTRVERARRDAAASATRGRFLATMSHEIRTPLNAIVGMTEILERADLAPEHREYVATIHEAGEQLVSVVSNVLDYSKLESGTLQLEHAPFNVRELVESVLDLFGAMAAKKNVELLVDVDPRAPQILIGDEARLRQVLTNLVGNAVKFTPAGSVRVQVGSVEVGERVRALFEVRDSGIGIEAEAIKLLFQPFRQADASTTREYGGTGLGLSISRTLVRAMGGDITVESTPVRASKPGGALGHGTTVAFSVLLDVSPSGGRLADDFHTLSGRRFLVVDDNDDNRRILGHALDEVRCEAVGANSGPAALHLLEKDRAFDGILLDIHMPGMDGWEVLRRMNDALLRTPVFILSSVGEVPSDLRARVSAVLTKPIRQRRLFQALAHMPSVRTQRVSHADLSRKVLVVDDSALNRRVLALLLSGSGLRLQEASSGDEALEVLGRETFDVVLMDVEMPGRDGLSTTREIRRTFPKARQPFVIALTANALTGDKQRCIDAGMDSYLPKPAKLEDILRIVASSPLISGGQNPESPNSPSVGQGSESADLASVRGLLGSLDPDTRADLESRMVLEMRARQSLISQSIAKQDWDALLAQLHTVKGSLALLGATELARAVEAVEAVAASRDTHNTRSAWERVQGQWEALEGALARSGRDGQDPR
jgi:signal transduction histidine kinase/DNA-binding response OmpR family regulator/HPt (histidine-containing phosphotransfer) domain-containing protein